MLEHNEDWAVANALDRVATSIENLGNAGAVAASGANMGAIEFLGMTLGASLDRIADSIEHLANALENQ